MWKKNAKLENETPRSVINYKPLNKYESFSGMVDKWHGPPKDCIISWGEGGANNREPP